MPRGVDVPSLDQDRLYDFEPSKLFKQGDVIGGGDMIGKTFENDLFSQHRIMVAPRVQGRLVEIMP